MKLKGNPDWEDVTPIPQDDGPHPIVPISYTDEFVEHMDYFRALLKSGEVSERALELTSAVIDLNSANYTAWSFRRKILFALEKNLEEELVWVADIAGGTPKNYQLWHHRRVLVDKIDKPMEELSHTAVVLQTDAKNYHVWTHRQWVLKRFKLWANELEYCDSLIKLDIRNNSAWNQRDHVINSTTGFTTEVVRSELNYTWSKIDEAPNNESPWNYLFGILNRPTFEQFEEMELRILAILEKDDACVAARSLLVELYVKWGGHVHLAKACEECGRLTEKDYIRRNYWGFRREQVSNLLGSS